MNLSPDEIQQLSDTIRAAAELVGLIFLLLTTISSGFIIWYVKTRKAVYQAQKELHIAQKALADEQRQQIPNLPAQISDAFANKLVEAVGPLAASVQSLTEANTRLTSKVAQMQIDHDHVCAELENVKLDSRTQREAWQRELKAKDDLLTEANTTIASLRAEIAGLRDRIVILEEKSQKVDTLVTKNEELEQERDAFKVRAETAEALVQKTLDENARLKKLLSDSEAGRAKAEAELLTRPPALPVAVRPDLPSDPSDPRV